MQITICAITQGGSALALPRCKNERASLLRRHTIVEYQVVTNLSPAQSQNLLISDAPAAGYKSATYKVQARQLVITAKNLPDANGLLQRLIS